MAGWAKQQRSRFLWENTIIERRLALVRRISDFTGLYLWQWQPAEAEAFISHLCSGPRPMAVSTARSYEITIKMFCAYLTDARYQWFAVCQQRFGEVPQQVFRTPNDLIEIQAVDQQARKAAIKGRSGPPP